jgi:glycosyltransferase involved in cell wall biosynthesis
MARNTIEENYTWDIVAQKYVKLFQKVIEGPK